MPKPPLVRSNNDDRRQWRKQGGAVGGRGLLDGVERTQKEVADAIGISQSYISRLEKRIIRQLREQLGE